MSGNATRIVRARTRSSCLGCAVQVAALAWLALLALGGLAVLHWGDLSRGTEQWLGIGVLIVWAGSILLILPAVMSLVVMRRNRRLDDAFEPLALEAQRVGSVTRGWSGSYEGRDLNAWFSRGPQLEIYLTADSGTRAAIGRGGRLGAAISAAMKRRALPLEDGPLAGYTLYAEDPVPFRALRTGDAAQALANLLDDDGRTIRSLIINPDSVKLQLRYLPLSAIHADNVGDWVAGLATVARVVDELPAPAEVKKPSRLEILARTGRKTLQRGVGCAMFLFLGVLAVVIAVVTGLVVFFS